MELIDAVILQNPTAAIAWASRAYVNGRRGFLEFAICDWSKAITFCGNEPHYFYMRGIDYFNLRKYIEAINDFTMVIEICDSHKNTYYKEPAYFFRADAYVRIKNFEKAKADCIHVSDEFTTWTDRKRCKADILADCFID